MKKIIPIILCVFAIVGSVACAVTAEIQARDYQRATRVYVNAAYNNGAISRSECRSLLHMASDWHTNPRVRWKKAEKVRRMVDRAYEQQRQRENNDDTYCALK